MHTRFEGGTWRALTYFSLWATRLSGFLPDLRDQPQAFRWIARIASQMLRTHIANLPERAWSKDTANDLRRFLIRQMEEHVERRFITPSVLEAL